MNSVDTVKIVPKGSYLSKRGYVIKKDSISQEELIYLKKTLKAIPLQDDKYNNTHDAYNIYTETKTKIYIPKMFGIERYGEPKDCLPNYTGKVWESEITFNGSLFDNQKEPCELLIKTCKEKGGGILHLATGFGKTVCLLYVLSQLKCKTIIVVNKIPLMRQWQTEIQKFLPNAKVGIIQGQNNVDIENKDIIIAMLQSLARIEYPDSFFNDIRLTAIDECHNLGSQMFSKVLFKLSSTYTVGLSATPTRADGCDYVFKWHIGDVIYKSSVKRKGLEPILKFVRVDSTEYKEISTVNKFTGEKQIQFTSMLTDLTVMPKRNKLILEIVKSLVKEDRKILVLSDRREHLKLLKKNFDEDLSVDFTYGLFLGQMKQKDLEISRSSNVILATFSAFGEGVSEKDLDTLVLITPKKFVGHLKTSVKNESGRLEQIVGRIFRKDHTERNPVIIDLQDNFSVYKNQSVQRRSFYKQHFSNATTVNQTINLDEYNLDTININCIKTIKTSVQKESDQDVLEKQNNEIKLLENCVIED